MEPARRLSRKQKGKVVAIESSPARDVDGTPLDDFELVHHEAMMDTQSLGLSERFLVSESAHLHRREVPSVTTEAQACARDGQDGARDGTPPVDFVPICYYPGGIFKELPSLSPELLRSPEARGQTWGNVLPTRSTVGSVKRLLRQCRGVGVTFLIPTGEQRPWSPPIGFQCVYESYFQDNTKLWFPIPRLVTSYARRRDAAISQFLNGSWRLAVALMVMAAEIDVTLNVRAFEELTSVNPLDEGLWSVKMRPNYNVVKGSYFFIKSDDSAFEDPLDDDCRVLWNALLGDHPSLRVYPEEFLSNARAIARLQQERWGNITRFRYRLQKKLVSNCRCVDPISRRDWSSIYLPATNTVKRRISLFTKEEQREINASRGMKGLPDLSAMMASQLGLPRPEPTDPPSETGFSVASNVIPERQDLSPVAVAAASKRKDSRKRSCSRITSLLSTPGRLRLYTSLTSARSW
ncbi:hypothetical protein N665_0852s0003 [Sinapis alba]|nr:hypothetical protein N665_0852s0003 [Sinapis alba]